MQKIKSTEGLSTFSAFGPSGEIRTHGLLNPIQARYQNCATPGYQLGDFVLLTGDVDYYTRLDTFCQQENRIFLRFFQVFLN